EFGNFGITVGGTLLAQGTAAKPIVFTTTRDKTVGGVTYNNGDTNAYGGQWGALSFTSTSTGSVLDHVAVRYGGESTPAAVVVNSAPLTLTNSTLANTNGAGLRVTGASPTVSDDTFLNNNGPAISIDQAANPLTRGSAAAGNSPDRIVVDSGTLAGDQTLSGQG